MLCELSGAAHVLELGTFTGYSALVLAGCSSVATVLTVERDPAAAAVARRFFARSQVTISIDLSIYLSIYLSICLSVCLSVYLSIYI